MSRVWSILAGVLCLLLVTPIAVAGEISAGDPPDLNAICGVWTVSYSGSQGALDTGAMVKRKAVGTWTITPDAGDHVQIAGFADGPSTILATYRYGVLFFGKFSESPQFAYTGYAQVTGVPTKLSLQGEVISVDVDTGDLYHDTLKGKWIDYTTVAPPPAPVHAHSAKGTVTPPSIDQLYDTYWIVKVSGKGYNFSDETPLSAKQTLYWHMTQGAEEGALEVYSTDGNENETMEMYYFHGILIMADGNDTDPAVEARCACLQVSGTPGKFKVTGNYVGYEIVGSDDEVEADKLSGKQSPPFPL